MAVHSKLSVAKGSFGVPITMKLMGIAFSRGYLLQLCYPMLVWKGL